MNRNFKKKLNPIWVANTLQCTGPIRIATVNDITRKIQTLVLNTPQNPYINQATPKKCLPKLTYPKQSWNRKFQTQNNPVGFHVSKNCRRILSAPLLMMIGFRKGGFRFFVYGSQQNLDPWWICCLSGQLNPPLGFTKHEISERKTKCKEESRSMLAWTICCAIVSWKLITNYCIPLETIAALRKHNVSWAVTNEYILFC